MYTGEKIFEYLHNALLKQWDPIGVKNVPQCQDEYDSYIPELYRIISRSNSADLVFDYLWCLETNYIGITTPDNELAKNATMRFAKTLFKLQQWIKVPQSQTITQHLPLHEGGYYVLYGRKIVGILSAPKIKAGMQIDFKLKNKIYNPFKRNLLYSLPFWTLQLYSPESMVINNVYSKNYFSKFMFQEIKTGHYVEFYLNTSNKEEMGINSYHNPLQFKPDRVILCGPYSSGDEEPPWVMGAEYEPGHIIWRMEYEAWFYYVWKWSFDRLTNNDKLAYLNRWNAPDDWRVFLFEWYYDLPMFISYLTVCPDVEYLFFWGHHGTPGHIGKNCLSQWYEASFTIEGTTYLTAEHYMMAEKAKLFGDEETLEQILQAVTAKDAKQYGREVRNFDKIVWEEKRENIVYTGNWAKFSQNPPLKEFLLRTNDKIIVEASPTDSVWGIGLSQNDPDSLNPDKWRGLNLLGFTLMKIRADL